MSSFEQIGSPTRVNAKESAEKIEIVPLIKQLRGSVETLNRCTALMEEQRDLGVTSPSPLGSVARANIELGRLDEAEAIVIKNSEPRYLLGGYSDLALGAYAQGEKTDPYLTRMREIVDQSEHPDFKQKGTINLITTLAEVDRFDEIRPFFEWLKEQKDEHVRSFLGTSYEIALVHVAEIYSKKGRFTNAMAAVSLIETPEGRHWAHLELLDALLKAGHLQKIKEAVTEAAGRREPLAEGKIGLAQKEAKAAGIEFLRPDELISLLEDLDNRHESDRSASVEEVGYFNTVRMQSLVRLDRTDLAKACIKEPYDAYELAEYLAYGGRLEEARQLIEDVVKDNSTKESWKKRLQALQEKKTTAEPKVREIKHDIEALGYAGIEDVKAGRSPKEALDQLHTLLDGPEIISKSVGDLRDQARRQIVRIEHAQGNTDAAVAIAREGNDETSIDHIIYDLAEKSVQSFKAAASRIQSLSVEQQINFYREATKKDANISPLVLRSLSPEARKKVTN
jgi:tetratricopeptide (TPR) repeat protein